ncbi:hypothetical protein TWF281_010716 [Arthrobotrys megalospora]
MTTPRRPRQTHGLNKENIPPGIISPRITPRQRRQTLSVPYPFSTDIPTEDEQEEQISRNDDDYDGDEIPFIGLSRHDVTNLRAEVAKKGYNSSGVGEKRRRRRFSGRFEVLRDVTGEFVNRDIAGRRGEEMVGKVLGEVVDEVGVDGRDGEVGVEVPEELEELEDDEVEVEEVDQAMIVTDIETDSQEDIESDDESYTSQEEDEEDENTDRESLFTSTLSLNNNTSYTQPLRTDNTALRALLHPSSYTDLRTTHLSNISLHQKWHLRKTRLKNKHTELHTSPPPDQTTKYHRPNRKIPKSFAKPATALFRHLGLYNNPSSKTAHKVLQWLRSEDELLLSQVSLVAPRLQFQHIQEVHEHAYQPLRTKLLEHLRENYGSDTWCLFFSEFVYANPRHEVSNGGTTVNGSCAFLMISSKETKEIKKVTEGMLKKLNQKEYEDENEEDGYEQDAGEGPSKSGVRGIGWPNFFSRATEPPTTITTPSHKVPYTPPQTIHSDNSSSLPSWDPSPTPSPYTPIKNIRSIHYNKPVFWSELDAFHYGLRWTTKLAIPAAEEGENAGYHEHPDIGSSLGARKDYGSGTLAGYMTDRKGEVYAMTCHHVLYFVDHQSIYPMRSNAIINSSSTQPISPSSTDLRNTTRATAHLIDGLMHEAICAYIKGNKPLSERITEQGRKKIVEHDRLVEVAEAGGAAFGSIVASAWRIAGMKGGSWIMDQVVMKPRIDRIGTNTFTYTGRDNKGGRRYRLEARGWTTLPLGAEVLKLGRTTGLTKGSVISVDADIRLLVGEDSKQTPTIHRVQRFWEVKCGIITSGTGPWFSDPGDSGAWILSAPSFEDMQKWDLRRSGASGVADPIPAPVGGMLFGGADSVDGINLTFYNPTKIIRKYLYEMLGDLGKELKPGFGGEFVPAPLDQQWEEQDAWSRQSTAAADAWAGFVDSGFWGHQKERYKDNHVFRDRKWWDGWDIKMKGLDTPVKTKGKTMVRAAGPKKNNNTHDDLEGEEEEEELTTHQPPPKPKLRFAETNTPRRRGTTEDAPDTPVSTLPKTRRVSPPYVAVERLMREMTLGKQRTPRANANAKTNASAVSGRKVGGKYVLSETQTTKPRYDVVDPVKQRVRRTVSRIEKEEDYDDVSDA